MIKLYLKKIIIHLIGYVGFLRLTFLVRVLQNRLMPGEIQKIMQFIQSRQGVILDIGANIGYTAHCFSQMHNAHVIAIEPDSDNLECLRTMLCNIPNITILGIAVGEKDSFVDFKQLNIAGVKQHALGKVVDSPGDTLCRSIDSLRVEYGKVNFIKIDVEGFEGNVFDGMIETLELDRPIIYCEICGVENLTKIRVMMDRLNYIPHNFHQNHFMPSCIDKNGNYLFMPA